MLVSELIEQLEEHMEEYGDLEVKVSIVSDPFPIDFVEFVSTESRDWITDTDCICIFWKDG
jgi:hypothetical protein